MVVVHGIGEDGGSVDFDALFGLVARSDSAEAFGENGCSTEPRVLFKAQDFLTELSRPQGSAGSRCSRSDHDDVELFGRSGVVLCAGRLTCLFGLVFCRCFAGGRAADQSTRYDACACKQRSR